MTDKEKVKAYDGAIERAKKVLLDCTSEERNVVEYLHPELKESDGEKIRKAIIQFFELQDDNTTYSLVPKKDILAWLEKQSEQGNNEDEAILHRFSFYSYKDEPNILYLAGLYVNDEYRNKGIGTKILKIADEVAVSMKCSSILLKTEIGSNTERLYKNNGYSVFRREENQVWLEKQGEQNQAEKVEPKFKVGDWICHTFYKKPLLIIEDLGGGDYKTEPKSLITAQGFKEGVYRLWTIQDAKDGDVLFCPMKKNSDVEEQIFLFYGVRDRGYVNNCVEYYCRVHDGVFYADENGYMGTTSSPVYPATKEQRDLFFQKMYDAGYEWDTENKQLKKLIKK